MYSYFLSSVSQTHTFLGIFTLHEFYIDTQVGMRLSHLAIYTNFVANACKRVKATLRCTLQLGTKN